jgi:signal transduction histidine kinase/ActR/RegA family two-component response regulator
MTEVYVLTEQIRTLYRQTQTVVVANCINALIVGALLWNEAPRPLLSAWMLAMAAVVATRVALSRRFRAVESTLRDARPWGRRFVLGSAASGTLWGAAALVFLEGAAPVSQLIIAFFVGGMCSAAAGTLAAHLPAFIAFVLPALALLAVRVALFGDSLHEILAAVVVLYGIGLVAVARVNARALRDAFALRFENADLLATLSVAQRGLEESNRTLEQRVAERSEALRIQSEALKDAQRLEAIGRLAGGVAHDFNNLLTIILANLSELAVRQGLDAQTRAALREMRDASSKGADLVRQLLTFSRRQRTAPETLDLNRVLLGMDRLLSRLLGDGVELRLELQHEPLFVHMDPTQMEQVIINMITNARDAMADGGDVVVVTDTIEIEQDGHRLAPGAYARLSVLDTGVGMDADTQRRIFEPFFTTKDLGKGTGLGLSTAHGIVEQGGGQIEVDSTPGLGSVFRVCLPLASAPSERARNEASSRSISGFQPITRATRRATVLLVEDEPTVRSVTQRILERAGHHVLAAPSAEQALEITAERADDIDLLITDVMMAGASGPSLASRLRAERPALRTLFISGYSHEHGLPAEEPHAVGFLAKPFTHDALLTKIAELMAPAPAARAEGSRGRGV